VSAVARPLDGVKVISLAHQYPGPFATMLLSDLGADVLTVERPDGGDPTRAFPSFHSALARGKRSVALDLKSEAGRSALLLLLADADAMLEGFRPGTMARLGFDPESVFQHRPELVYVSISGFGQTGPNRQRSGHDLTYQAEAGMLYEHLPPSPPAPAPALAIGDLAAGMFAAQAVLVGLVQRARTGRGCYTDVSMVDCLSTMLSCHVGPVVNQSGPPGFPYEPGYGVFVTSDGAHLALAVAHEDHFWRALCDVTGLGADGDLGSAARFAQHNRLREDLTTAIAKRPRAEWERAFTAADVPFGCLRSLGELPGTPQSVAREIFTMPLDSAEGPTVHVRQPLVIDGVGLGPVRGTPELGEHTAEALQEAGMNREAIFSLLASGSASQPCTSANTSPEQLGEKHVR
jgi:crotonobetainyl-CoA:carnitine CoA-transferase CaiB-like acyl-CoA transferase